MVTTAPALESLTFTIIREIHVRSSITATFAAILEQLGPANEGQAGKPMPMVLEAWPGGRWYRDLGDNNGHFWAHVQAIKRPTLLELNGPMFMSTAVASNIQYRLAEGDGGTKLTLRHSILGQLPDGFHEGYAEGLDELIARIRKQAEAAA